MIDIDPKNRLQEERSANKEQRMKTIIKAAQTIFIQNGLEQATMQDIANEANIGVATLFRYFPRKEKLLVAVIVGIIEVNIPIFQAAENVQGSCIQKIEKIFDIYILFNKEKQERTKLVAAFETYAAQHNEPLEDIDIYGSTFGEIKIIFSRIIDGGKKDGSIRQDIDVEKTYFNLEGISQLMKSPSLNLRFSSLQGIYWMCFCAMYGFASVFLLDKNFDNQGIGFILAASNILSVVLQPTLGSLIDRLDKLTLKFVMSSISMLTIFLLVLLIFLPGLPLQDALLYTLIVSLTLTLQPLINSLAFEHINAGMAINYGLTRGVGSLSFGITSFFLGQLLSRYNATILPIICLGLYFLLLILILSFPNIDHTDSLGSVFGSIIAGWLLDSADITTMLSVGSVSAFIGSILIIYSVRTDI